MRRGFGLIWLFGTALIAGVASYFAYGAGWTAGVATKLPAGSTVPYYLYGPHPYFGFGFVWFLLFLLFIFWLFRRMAGFGRWNGGGRQRFDDRMRDWHRQAHEQQTPPQPS